MCFKYCSYHCSLCLWDMSAVRWYSSVVERLTAEIYLHCIYTYMLIINTSTYSIQPSSSVVFSSLLGWFGSSVATAWEVSYSPSILSEATFWVRKVSLWASFLPSYTVHRPTSALLSIPETSLHLKPSFMCPAVFDWEVFRRLLDLGVAPTWWYWLGGGEVEGVECRIPGPRAWLGSDVTTRLGTWELQAIPLPQVICFWSITR